MVIALRYHKCVFRYRLVDRHIPRRVIQNTFNFKTLLQHGLLKNVFLRPLVLGIFFEKNQLLGLLTVHMHSKHCSFATLLK